MFFFFKQKTAYEMRISDWSSDVCSSDLKLGNVNETMLASYLKNEYPQTVAVVLSKIKPEHAARVLGVLPEAFAMEVVMRMLRMEAVQKEVLDDVERTLRTEFMSKIGRAHV